MAKTKKITAGIYEVPGGIVQIVYSKRDRSPEGNNEYNPGFYWLTAPSTSQVFDDTPFYGPAETAAEALENGTFDRATCAEGWTCIDPC